MIIIDFEIGHSLVETVYTMAALEKRPAFESVYIDSPGGSTAVAFAFAEKMKAVPRVCYVKKAQSAALQIVMPGCQIVYASRSSVFGPHSAHVQFPKTDDMYSVLDLASLTQQLFNLNNKMATGMIIKYGRDATCPKTAAPMLFQFSKTCIGTHMLEAKTFNTEEYNNLWGNPPIIQVIQEEKMPSKTQKPTGL